MAEMKHQIVLDLSMDCAHQLALPYASKCNRLHGHTYRIKVCVEADTLDPNGMVVDFAVLKDLFFKESFGTVAPDGLSCTIDHNFLNAVLPSVVDRYCKGLFPAAHTFHTTGEELAQVFAHALQSKVATQANSPRVVFVEVSETCTSGSRYYMPEVPRNVL